MLTLKLLNLLKFFKTRLGILILLAGIVFTFVFLTKSSKSLSKSQSQSASKSSESSNSKETKSSQVYFSLSEGPKEQPITTINRNTASVKTIIAPQPHPQLQSHHKIIRETVIQNTPETKTAKVSSEKPIPIILSIYDKIMKEPLEDQPPAKKPPITKEKEPRQVVPPKFAPFGRMIKCELINTLDSGNLETPIIGLVMEPIYWNGDLIIPAGSEVHGIATTDKLRERIVSGDKWNVILPADSGNDRPNGMALSVIGVALDREDPSGEGKSYGLADGSFGLKGHRIKSNDLEEIKVFAATFLGAMATGLQTQVPTGSLWGGTQPESTLQNASLGGISSVMNRLAEKIEKEIADNGFYTRVPAGKQFYLYVQQNINPEDWDMASSLKKEQDQPSVSIKDPDLWIEKLTELKEKLTEF